MSFSNLPCHGTHPHTGHPGDVRQAPHPRLRPTPACTFQCLVTWRVPLCAHTHLFYPTRQHNGGKATRQSSSVSRRSLALPHRQKGTLNLVLSTPVCQVPQQLRTRCTAQRATTSAGCALSEHRGAARPAGRRGARLRRGADAARGCSASAHRLRGTRSGLCLRTSAINPTQLPCFVSLCSPPSRHF